MTDNDKAREIAAKRYWRDRGYGIGATGAMLEFSDRENSAHRLALEEKDKENRMLLIEHVKNETELSGHFNCLLSDARKEIEHLQSRAKELEDKFEAALNLHSEWPLTEIVSRLCDAAHILLNEKNYDGTGHEMLSAAMKHGKAWYADLITPPEGKKV